MNTINSIVIEGRLVRDPVLKLTPNGTEVCSFSLATNRYYMSNNEKVNETSFFDVETWARLAELCGENCTKGRGVRVVGRLKQDRWVGTDGKHYSKIKVVAEHIEFKPLFKNGKQPADALDDMREETVPEKEAVPAF